MPEDQSWELTTVDEEGLHRMIAVSLVANVPLMIWGDPGIGKTEIVRATAPHVFVEAGAGPIAAPFHVMSGTSMDALDVGGLPVVYEDPPGTRWETRVPEDWMRGFADVGGGVVFIDEITATRGSTQNAFLRLVLERMYGSRELPAYTRFVLAGNPVEQVTSGGQLGGTVANRMLHVHFAPSRTEKLALMQSGRYPYRRNLDPNGRLNEARGRAWPRVTLPDIVLGPGLAEELAPLADVIAALVSGFLVANPHAWHRMPPTRSKSYYLPWPSDRTIDFLVDALAAAAWMGVDVTRPEQAADPLVSYIAQAAIGPVGHQFTEYVAKRDLPDPADVIRDPTALTANPAYATVPLRMDQAILILHSIHRHHHDTYEALLRDTTRSDAEAAAEMRSVTAATTRAMAAIGMMPPEGMPAGTIPTEPGPFSNVARSYFPDLISVGAAPTSSLPRSTALAAAATDGYAAAITDPLFAVVALDRHDNQATLPGSPVDVGRQ